MVKSAHTPDLRAPAGEVVNPFHWVRQNLFSSPTNAVLTVVSLLFLFWIIPPILRWALLDANWVGESRQDCVRDGACWVFIKVRFAQFMYGFYPEAERWRVNATFLLFGAASVPLFFRSFPWKVWIGAFLLVVYPIVGFILMVGGIFGLPVVETTLWGGLTVTLVVAGVGIAASLPVGVVLALGRRSSLPIIRALATAFIEILRGIPLITVLFMASVMLPMFFPEGMNFDKLLRALVGVALFAGAYMAEVVRGGLQAIPRGQFEAAAALGLGYWRMMGLVILPQALRIVIPGIVNTFIGLFKDTTLVLIIGLFDLLGMIQAATADPKWLGLTKEGYAFAAVVFWIFCFGMSRLSQHLEQRLEIDKKE